MLRELFVLCGSGKCKPLKHVEASPAGVVVNEEAVSAELALEVRLLGLNTLGAAPPRLFF
jgi:hypothetical protein